MEADLEEKSIKLRGKMKNIPDGLLRDHTFQRLKKHRVESKQQLTPMPHAPSGLVQPLGKISGSPPGPPNFES